MCFWMLCEKLVKNNLKGCEKCRSFFTHGKNISEDEKFMLEHNTKFMSTRDEGGLMWPKNNVNTLCGILVTIFSNLLEDSKTMSHFNESATSSRVGLQVLRCMINMKLQNHPMLKIPNSTCNNYKCSLRILHEHLVTTTVSARANSMTMVTSRIKGAKKDSL